MAVTTDHELRIDAQVAGQTRAMMLTVTAHARITEGDLMRGLAKAKLYGKDLAIIAGSSRLIDLAKMFYDALKENGCEPTVVTARWMSPVSIYTPGAQHDGEKNVGADAQERQKDLTPPG